MLHDFVTRFDAAAVVTNCETQLLVQTMPEHDRIIFFIGCPLVIIATLMLIIGSFKFKELRKQPGDIILGIAVSDFILACHWLSMAISPQSISIVSSDPTQVNNNTFCMVDGSIGTLAGLSEYLYNITFNVYLIICLRHALKQDKIPKKLFHVVVVLLSIVGLLLLIHTHSIGKTVVGTCSIKSHCKPNVFNFSGPFIVLFYVILGLYTFWYIRKNVHKCKSSDAKGAAFLMYYLKYIVASTIVYGCISATNFASTALTQGYMENLWETANPGVVNTDDVDGVDKSDAGKTFAIITVSLYNVSKLASPLILSFIRFRDPLIKNAIKKTINAYFKRSTSKTLSDPLVEGDSPNQQQQKVEHLDDAEGEDNNGFMITQMQADKKIQVTYTLLTCVLYGDYSQRNSLRDPVNVVDRKSKNLYKHERIFQITDEGIKSEVPKIKEELTKKDVQIMPGSLKAYAPELFMNFLNDDKDFLDLQQSLDFIDNTEEIKNASGAGGGRSGEFFFFSKDKKLIVKTIPDAEMKALVSILERYDEHYKTYPKSLIAKIYGAFTFISSEYGEKYNVVIMKNLNGFGSSYVKRCYDMKGSTYEREVIKNQTVEDKAELKQFGVMKDKDFVNYEKKLYIKDEFRGELLRQIEADSLFFRRAKLMDYSFMVFCVDKKQYEDEHGALNDAFTAKNPLGSLENTAEPGMYYNIGVVDFLQPYNFQKFFEKWLKRVKTCNMKLDTSTQDPQRYSSRFIHFVSNLIKKDE